jgi:hypothetical protein
MPASPPSSTGSQHSCCTAPPTAAPGLTRCSLVAPRRSYLRAYASVPSAVKSIFAMRRLHTGHVAHSFGLADTPTTLGSSGSAAERKKRKQAAASNSVRSRKKAIHKAAQQLMD